jgi:chemotaxis protein MotB
MRRRKKFAGHGNRERWLVSYADFITLLFAFFVVLYASSQVDQRKVGKLAMAIQVAFQEMGVFQASTTQVPMDLREPMPFSTAQAIENVERTASIARVASHPEGTLAADRENGDLRQLQTDLEATLAAEIKRNEIAMRSGPDGLVISLREAGFFESGSAQMKSTSQPAFDRIANMLRQRDCRVRIEGHTDNVPIHTAQFSSNWELSTARATEVVRLLIVRDGYSPDHLSAAGYAEYRPIASNATAEGRSLNRRVDIVILRQDTAAGAAVRAETPEPNAPVSQNQEPMAPGAQPANSTAPASAVPPAPKNAENTTVRPSPVIARKPAAATVDAKLPRR